MENASSYLRAFLVHLVTYIKNNVPSKFHQSHHHHRYVHTEPPWRSIHLGLRVKGLIILGIILDLGGGPNHDRIGFRYWKNPGPFVQFSGIGGSKGKFLGELSLCIVPSNVLIYVAKHSGWWAVMTQAAFSFIGTEIVAVIAPWLFWCCLSRLTHFSPTADRRRRGQEPATKIFPKRSSEFTFVSYCSYIGGTAIIGLLVPSNEPALNLKSHNVLVLLPLSLPFSTGRNQRITICEFAVANQ